MKSTPPELSIAALRAGDRAEFARMVDIYSAPIYRLELKMLGNAQDAEDALQNVFLKALTHLKDFEGRSSLSTWLYRIASNEALMTLRRKKPAFNLEDLQIEDSDETPPPQTFIDWSSLPENELLSSESQRALEAAVQQLPAALRMTFLLRDVENLSIKETAEALNLTETNVKTRLLRARLFLRERLSAYHSERVAGKETS
ncbi:MAG: sigma-70 family RNA polymerase sigma factor [Anaerolineales bacterium]